MNIKTSFWCHDPCDAAVQVRAMFPAQAEECLCLADDICENRFTFRGHWEMERTHIPVSFPGAIAWDQAPGDDPEWVFALNRHSFLVVLGKAWRFTGDRRYPAAFARLIADWIRRVPLTEDSKATTWRPIETGLRCENWLRGLSLMENSGALNEELQSRIEDSLRVHADWLLEAHGPFQRLSNWGVLQDHGLLLLGFAFGQPAWCDTAATRLNEQLHHQVFTDGTHWEQSPLYHCEVLHCCLDAVQAAGRMNYRLPDAFLERTHAMARALAAMLRPDGRLLCQSDTDEIDARDLLALAALLFGDGALKGRAAGLYEENLWDFADRTDACRAIAVEKVEGSAALPDSGNYMLWGGDGPEANFLHFRCGCLGSGHGHADLLHIDLVSRGESVLTDSGRYTYVDCPLREQLKRPSAHNTATVDGRDFTVYQNSWRYGPIAEPLKSEHRFTPCVDYVSGAHLGYLRDSGVVHRRRVLRLGEELWVIWDNFYTADDCAPHRYQRYFHFGPEGHAVKTANGAAYQGGRCAARVVCPSDSSLVMERVPLSREYNRLEEGDCLRLETSIAGDASLPAIIATGPPEKPPELEVIVMPVTMASSGRELSARQAQALRIAADGGEWTVIALHTEVISEVDLVCAGTCAGYGKVLVFGPPCPDGLHMAW